MVQEHNSRHLPHSSSNDHLLQPEQDLPGSSESTSERCSVSEEEDALRGPIELPYGEEDYSPIDTTHGGYQHVLSSGARSLPRTEHVNADVLQHHGTGIQSTHLEETGDNGSHPRSESSSDKGEPSERQEPQISIGQPNSMIGTTRDNQMSSYQIPSQSTSYTEDERHPSTVPGEIDNSQTAGIHGLTIEHLTQEEEAQEHVRKKPSYRQLSTIPEQGIDTDKSAKDTPTSRDNTTGWFTPSESRPVQHDIYAPFSDEQETVPVQTTEEAEPLSIPNTQTWQNQDIGLAISPGTSHTDLNQARNHITDERRYSLDSDHSPTHIPVRKNLEPVHSAVFLPTGSQRFDTYSAVDLTGSDSIHLDQKKDTFPPNHDSKKDHISFGQTSTFAPATNKHNFNDSVAPAVQSEGISTSNLGSTSGYTPPSDHNAPRERARYGGKALAAEDEEHDHDQFARRMTIAVHQAQPANNLSRHATIKSMNSGELEDEAETGVAKSQMLGDISIIALIVDQILGSAIYATPAIIMATVQSAKTTLIVWALASVQAITGYVTTNHIYSSC